MSKEKKVEVVEKVEVKEPVIRRAYMMTPGSNSLQYRLFELTLKDDEIVSKKEIGVPELKSIVVGRLLRQIVKL